MGRPRTCNCGTCKKCLDRKRKAAQYAAMTPAQRRAWRKKKDPLKRYVTNRRARAKHVAKYPEKAAARKALQVAIREGKITRQPCFVCLAVHGARRADGTSVKVEAHHKDYTKPLDVTWVCTQHHRPPWVKDRG